MAKGRKTGGKDWKPGQSGNPKGRPPSNTTLTELLREAGEIQDAKWNGETMARKQALANIMWMQALRGADATQRYIYDRIDGKPTQEIKVGGNVKIDAPIHLHVGATIEAVDEEENAGTSDGDDS